jgi:hypothetical protein
MASRRFPIQGCPSSYPCDCRHRPFGISWDAIAPHEPQALRNHSQSLAILAARGGLSWNEALCVLEDRRWTSADNTCKRAEVEKIVAAFEKPPTAETYFAIKLPNGSWLPSPLRPNARDNVRDALWYPERDIAAARALPGSKIYKITIEEI